MKKEIVTKTELTPAIVESALINQDINKLDASQRLEYYKSVCESLGLNPLTRPFAYITLNGKLTLYALKDCTEQLRKINNVSIEIISRESTEGIYVVVARATNGDGRRDESIGAVPFDSKLFGESRANAVMKCETKAKRRVTLSICGLGMLDETEVSSIPGATIGEPNGKPVTPVDPLPIQGAMQQSAQPEPEAPTQQPAPPKKPAKPAKTPAPAPEAQPELENPPEAPETQSKSTWEDYIICQMPSIARYQGKRLADLPREDFAYIKKNWVDKNAEKFAEHPAKKLEADMILEGYKYHLAQEAA